MLNGVEKELLKEISRRLVVKKEELALFLEKKGENPQIINRLMKDLYSKGLIIYVTPIGQTCYAITQRGMREAGLK